MRCLRIILGISLPEEKRSMEIHKVAKQQRMSSVLMRKRLCSVGHIEHMKDECVLKKFLVCAPEHGKRSAGGQRLRWSDGTRPVLAREGSRAQLMEAGHCSEDGRAQCRGWKRGAAQKR